MGICGTAGDELLVHACREGELVREVASIGLLDSIPIEFDATREGPRQIGWRADKGCVLNWVEAQDEGDPKNFPNTSPRDIVYAVDLSPTSPRKPQQIAATDLRCVPLVHASHACLDCILLDRILSVGCPQHDTPMWECQSFS